MVPDRECEALRHDADHGVDHVAQANRPPHHGRIAREPRLPDIMADHHDRGSPGVLVVLDERSAEKGWHPRQLESRGRDLGDEHGLVQAAHRPGRAILDHQVALDRLEGADIHHRPQTLAPTVQVEPGRFESALRLVIPGLEGDHPLPLVERQPASESQVEEGEDDHTDDEDDGHRQTADQCQSPGLAQHAQAQLDIQPQGIDPR